MTTQTMRVVDPMIAELEQEAATTRQMLDRVPDDKLEWRPHPKSMSLGQLALHIAAIWDGVGSFLEMDGFDVNNADFQPATPESKDAILKQFEDSVAEGKRRLTALDNETAMESWCLRKGDAEIFTVPKIALARSLMMNHLYHHRGQLSVYLRLLDVPVPVSYGRSADEDPFA